MAAPARSRPAVVWLQLLLIGGLASVVLILVQAWRSTSSNTVVAERALTDYADFAAWSYREHLMAHLRDVVDEVLGAVNHGDGLHQAGSPAPHARELGHYLPFDERCACHRPRVGPLPLRYYGFTLGADTIAQGENLAAEGAPGWLVDPPSGYRDVPVARVTGGESRWLNRHLSDAARDSERTTWGYRLIVAPYDGTHRMLAMRAMPTAWGDTVVYAVEYSRGAADSLLTSVLSSGSLLPTSLVGRRAPRELLDLEVSDRNRHVLFTTSRRTDWELDAVTMLPASFAGLHVRAQIRESLAEQLLIGGVPASRVPLLLILLMLAVGLTAWAAWQLRREVQFATERANFVASVSHELRTPLAQVRLVLDTLKLGREGDRESRDAALGIADREVLRLQHLVEAVLQFTRGPRDDAPRVASDIAQEARAIAAEFAPLARPRGVTIAVRGDAPVTARLQPGALRQVLLNLLDNAVKYGPDHALVVVHVQQVADGAARVSVSDAGPGVPPADRARIWDAFERGSAGATHAAGGSGIGLTIVQQIATLHGGRAWVEDVPTGGAMFVFEVPATGGAS
jgi:signal transduction histidine kinase